MATLKKHLGQYRFQCDVCNKGFMDHSNLEGHMSVHTDKKVFKSPMCPRSYGYKQPFKAHLKQKHGIADEEKLVMIIDSTKMISKMSGPD